MGKCFNTSGACFSDIHYMVDISSRADQIIQELVLRQQYFTINRARQYGKTTILDALYQKLKKDYSVFFLSFEDMGSAAFTDEYQFCKTFLRLLKTQITCGMTEGIPDTVVKQADNQIQEEYFGFPMLKDFIMDMCMQTDRAIVLMIDEVDQACNNQVFLDFLGILRSMYLRRRYICTFQSVVLAGVYDIKNIRWKIRPQEQHKYNSPWNISADFNIDLSFSVSDIAGMLREYEQDCRTGMDIVRISQMLRDYTGGYPFLVSRLCKLMDERVPDSRKLPDKADAWSKEGFLEAVRILLSERNPLFDSLMEKLSAYPELKQMIEALLFQGQSIAYNPDDDAVGMAMMFGFVKTDGSSVSIANRIFEMRLYNLFLTTPQVQGSRLYKAAIQDQNQFVENGHLNMRLVLEKFVTHFNDLYGDQKKTFYEEDGRRYFLLYLRPIINGTGNYYIEADTRNRERTDVIIDYRGEQIVIELKIWRGDAYHTRGERQLLDYLDHYHLKKGYMISFHFSKNKEIGVREVLLGDKVLVEAVV